MSTGEPQVLKMKVQLFFKRAVSKARLISKNYDFVFAYIVHLEDYIQVVRPFYIRDQKKNRVTNSLDEFKKWIKRPQDFCLYGDFELIGAARNRYFDLTAYGLTPSCYYPADDVCFLVYEGKNHLLLQPFFYKHKKIIRPPVLGMVKTDYDFYKYIPMKNLDSIYVKYLYLRKS